MSDDKNKVISFADELFKRTGVQLDLAKVAEGHAASTRRVKVDPNSDFVIGMAMDILSLVTPYADSNPIGVIAALQVVGNTLGEEYIRKIGRDKVKELLVAATVISQQYKPEFKDGNASSEPVAGNQEDDSKR